jgi:hypothetical protein
MVKLSPIIIVLSQMNWQNPYLPEKEQFPLLEKLKGRVSPRLIPEGYDTLFENRVMEKIEAVKKFNSRPKAAATIFISMAWISSAAACFFLTFHFSSNPTSELANNPEMAYILEEFHLTSEEELQEWITQNKQEVTQEILLNELSEYELDTE